MAVLRSLNILGQMRVDVPHIRAIESSVVGDFDLLAGKMLAGRNPKIISGFNVLMPNSIGQPASNLQINVQGGMLIHYGASESGSIFASPATATTEQLSATNPNVRGSFTAATTNYVGLDLTRTADATTADIVQFRNATSQQEVANTVPLARTLQYRLIISPNAFSAASNVCPIAKVVTDAGNNVVSIADARSLMFRLGSGGDSPSASHLYVWATRTENAVTSNSSAVDPFAGGDKSLGSMKDWMDAVMMRLWELGGGQYWYGATTDRSIKMIRGGSPFPATGDQFNWTGTNLYWQGISFLFGNSAQYYNTLADVVIDTVGLTDLAIGEAIVVDLNVNGTTPTVSKRTLTALGNPADYSKGPRIVMAWRAQDGAVYTRDFPYSVGTPLVTVAAVGTLGVVKLSTAAADPANPKVAVVDSTQLVVGAGLSRSPALGGSCPIGPLTIGAGTNDNAILLGKTGQLTTLSGLLRFSDTTSTGTPDIDRTAAAVLNIGTAAATTINVGRTGQTVAILSALTGARGATITTAISNGVGVTATGNGTGAGVWGTGGAGVNAIGVLGTGGSTGGIGVYGTGTGGNSGVFGGGGAMSGSTVTGGTGVTGTGGNIVASVSGSAGAGVYGSGGAASGAGDNVDGVGVYGLGGGTSGNGVEGHSGGSTGYGVAGFAPLGAGGSGAGVLGTHAGSGPGVVARSTTGSAIDLTVGNSSRGSIAFGSGCNPSASGTLQNGDVWLDSATGRLRIRIGGSIYYVLVSATPTGAPA